MTHSVANHLAAAEFDLATVSAILRDQVALDFDEKLRVGKANLVADCRAEHLGIEDARQLHDVVTASRLPFR